MGNCCKINKRNKKEIIANTVEFQENDVVPVVLNYFPYRGGVEGLVYKVGLMIADEEWDEVDALIKGYVNWQVEFWDKREDGNRVGLVCYYLNDWSVLLALLEIAKKCSKGGKLEIVDGNKVKIMCWVDCYQKMWRTALGLEFEWDGLGSGFAMDLLSIDYLKSIASITIEGNVVTNIEPLQDQKKSHLRGILETVDKDSYEKMRMNYSAPPAAKFTSCSVIIVNISECSVEKLKLIHKVIEDSFGDIIRVSQSRDSSLLISAFFGHATQSLVYNHYALQAAVRIYEKFSNVKIMVTSQQNRADCPCWFGNYKRNLICSGNIMDRALSLAAQYSDYFIVTDEESLSPIVKYSPYQKHFRVHHLLHWNIAKLKPSYVLRQKEFSQLINIYDNCTSNPRTFKTVLIKGKMQSGKSELCKQVGIHIRNQHEKNDRLYFIHGHNEYPFHAMKNFLQSITNDLVYQQDLFQISMMDARELVLREIISSNSLDSGKNYPLDLLNIPMNVKFSKIGSNLMIGDQPKVTVLEMVSLVVKRWLHSQQGKITFIIEDVENFDDYSLELMKMIHSMIQDIGVWGMMIGTSKTTRQWNITTDEIIELMSLSMDRISQLLVNTSMVENLKSLDHHFTKAICDHCNYQLDYIQRLFFHLLKTDCFHISESGEGKLNVDCSFLNYDQLCEKMIKSLDEDLQEILKLAALCENGFSICILRMLTQRSRSSLKRILDSISVPEDYPVNQVFASMKQLSFHNSMYHWSGPPMFRTNLLSLLTDKESRENQLIISKYLSEVGDSIDHDLEFLRYIQKAKSTEYVKDTRCIHIIRSFSKIGGYKYASSLAQFHINYLTDCNSPMNYQLHWELANILFMQHQDYNYPGRKFHLNVAHKLNPKDPRILFALFYYHYLTGDFQISQSYSNQLLKLAEKSMIEKEIIQVYSIVSKILLLFEEHKYSQIISLSEVILKVYDRNATKIHDEFAEDYSFFDPVGAILIYSALSYFFCGNMTKALSNLEISVNNACQQMDLMRLELICYYLLPCCVVFENYDTIVTLAELIRRYCDELPMHSRTEVTTLFSSVFKTFANIMKSKDAKKGFIFRNVIPDLRVILAQTRPSTFVLEVLSIMEAQAYIRLDYHDDALSAISEFKFRHLKAIALFIQSQCELTQSRSLLQSALHQTPDNPLWKLKIIKNLMKNFSLSYDTSTPHFGFESPRGKPQNSPVLRKHNEMGDLKVMMKFELERLLSQVNRHECYLEVIVEAENLVD